MNHESKMLISALLGFLITDVMVIIFGSTTHQFGVPNVHFSAKLGFQRQTCFSAPNSDFSAKLFFQRRKTPYLLSAYRQSVEFIST